MTAAHSTIETIRLSFYYPEHAPRESDPHYSLFNAARRRLERLGALVCWRCGSREHIELHHSTIEFSLANGVDVERFGELYPEFHIGSDEEFLCFVESEGNLLPLCVDENAPIVMADGSLRPIREIKIGDQILGADGKPNNVLRTFYKSYSGTLYEVAPDVWATPEHPILTRRGWVPIGTLRRTDFLYAVPNQLMGAGLAPKVSVSEMYDVVPTFDEEVVSHLVVGDSGGEQLPISQGTGKDLPYFRWPDEEWRGANLANIFDTHISLGAGNWIQTSALRSKEVSCIAVRDVSVESSHSFLANGILMHNCVDCHRGEQGIHSVVYPAWLAGRFWRKDLPAPGKVIRNKK